MKSLAFSNDDLELLRSRGITIHQIENQIKSFETGFPYLKLIDSAKIGTGIFQPNSAEQPAYLQSWENYLQSDAGILKFVPASGAASRMFKDLFEYLDGESDVPVKPFEKNFFNDIKAFAFYDELNTACLRNEGKNIDELITTGNYKPIVANLLLEKGLNYGALPKGLLRFHNYAHEKRTPLQEHLAEGALYATNRSKKVNIHFTVSAEHRALFEEHWKESQPLFEQKFGVQFSVTFSEQKPSTDTIAVDTNNEPFRDNGKLVFRPGGHGALIENLNDLDADVIFIKNIDNVVPDSGKEITVTYKKLIAGILVSVQKQCFEYLKWMEMNKEEDKTWDEILRFTEKNLNCSSAATASYSASELRKYLFDKLNRPIRVCGMVKNVGEPGGGPFLTVNQDGSVSLQILESSQIDLKNETDKEIFTRSTHFNPVDLVCAVKNYKGEKFDLTKYVDKKTGFISSKSKNGKELKALELPGLWNGAMSDWNTIFVEVPLETFNPVKTVNDLLRKEHQ